MGILKMQGKLKVRILPKEEIIDDLNIVIKHIRDHPRSDIGSLKIQLEKGHLKAEIGFKVE